MTHPMIGRAAVVNTTDGDERPGTVQDVEQHQGDTRVVVETEDGPIDTSSERVEVLN